MELLGLFEGNLIRLFAGFVIGFVVAWLIPSPKVVTDYLEKKRELNR